MLKPHPCAFMGWELVKKVSHCGLQGLERHGATLSPSTYPEAVEHNEE